MVYLYIPHFLIGAAITRMFPTFLVVHVQYFTCIVTTFYSSATTVYYLCICHSFSGAGTIFFLYIHHFTV